MEKFLLIDEEGNSNVILDITYSRSVEDAQQYFCNQGWVTGVVIAEADL